MTTRGIRAADVARIALELILATFAIWLVVQNTLLLWQGPWAPHALAVAGVLFKVARMLVAALWPWPLMILAVSSMLGAAIAAGLLGGVAAKEVRRA